jgi:tRNA (guanosine-2'-O-)-methyltransferase
VFPYEDPIDVAELLELDEPLELSAQEIKELLGPQVSEDRRERIAAVVGERTYGVIPVMEGLYDLGNVAAVLRSAEAMGYQEVHFIDTQEGQKTSRRVTQGADKWVDLNQWESTTECVQALKDRGYKICVTHLEAAKPLREIDFTVPTALVFGNEQKGVSEEMVELADERCIIPMLGFVESFNISVAAALSLYEAMGQRIEKFGAQGDLSPEEQEILEAHFLIRAVKTAPLLLPGLVRRGMGKGDESPQAD